MEAMERQQRAAQSLQDEHNLAQPSASSGAGGVGPFLGDGVHSTIPQRLDALLNQDIFGIDTVRLTSRKFLRSVCILYCSTPSNMPLSLISRGISAM